MLSELKNAWSVFSYASEEAGDESVGFGDTEMTRDSGETCSGT